MRVKPLKIVARVTPSQLNGDQMDNASLATIVFQHVTSCGLSHIWLQARNQGPKPPLENFSPPSLEKCVGHSLKLLDTVQKIWAPGVPSWLRACMAVTFYKVLSPRA